MKKRFLLLSLVLGISLSTPLVARDNILIENKGLYPEGISFDADKKHFYVSSVSRGEVWRINNNGKSELFAKNNKFASTIGLLVDNKRNRLLVCVSDPGVGENSTAKTKGKLAGLVVYDLKTKNELAYYDLSTLSNDNKGLFANDVTLDEAGNSYITDSFSPVIYKIDTQGNMSIFSTNPKWEAPEGKFGLNGIVHHPDGFLIVAHYHSGKLYKVDVKNPQKVEEIKINQINKKWQITGLDGLLLLNNETLVAVNVSPSGREHGNAVYRLVTNNDWESVEMNSVMLTGNTYPTTLTKTGKDIFVLHAKLLELFTGNKSPKKTFEIEKVSFSDLN